MTYEHLVGTVMRAQANRPMTVGLLRKLLLDLPAEAPVVMFSDAEGNAVRPLLEVEFIHARLDPSGIFGGYTVETVGKDLVVSALLVPFD